MAATDPTPEEIRQRRAEIHIAKGKPEEAKWILENLGNDYSHIIPDDEDNDPRFKSIHEIGLAPRIAGPLSMRGVFFASELATWTEERLRMFPNFGDGSIEEIRVALANIGLKLRASTPGELIPNLPGRLEMPVSRRQQQKLTDKQVDRMFELIASGNSQRSIAKMLGIQRWTVWNRLRIFKAAVRAMFEMGATEKKVQRRVGRDRWKVWTFALGWDQRKKHGEKQA